MNQTFEPLVGEHIHRAAKRAIDTANAIDCGVSFDFNGVRVTASPGDTVEAVVGAWEAEMDRIAALPENVEARKRREAEAEERRGEAQRQIGEYMRLLPVINLSDVRQAIRWLCGMQEHADHIGVTYDRDGVIAAFVAAGYKPNALCSRMRKGHMETEREWGRRVGANGKRKWLIGQALHGIINVGAPHPMILKFAADFGIAP